ncbi:MAG: ABC transporter permease [Syntrophaceticus schinkii]|jgi:ABC-2 type transport system permease protein|nr:ABC transporter permease [Syntrophaceticus schinkii]MDD4262562.1 ABC transporter permease [Syntrophaceticus schinkii]MDD4675650.1 ABC transporter permease [Syntrophaceticus schinkii]
MSVRTDYHVQSKTALLPSWLPIVWEEFITWRNKFWMYIISYMLSPLIFLLSFGMGVGQRMKMMMPGGMSYLEFLVPGVVALALFNNGMTSVMTRMYYSRIHYKSFDSYRLAPAGNLSIWLGYTLGGMMRGLASGLIVILVISFIVPLRVNPAFFGAVLLTAFCFASFAVMLSLFMRTFDDQALINELILIPVTYLSGTLVPVERLPELLQPIVWCFPLTPAAKLLRSTLAGTGVSLQLVLLLVGWIVLFFILGLYRLNKMDA